MDIIINSKKVGKSHFRVPGGTFSLLNRDDGGFYIYKNGSKHYIQDEEPIDEMGSTSKVREGYAKLGK